MSASLVSKQKETSILYALFISCGAALGGFLFGFDTAVINGAILALENVFHAGKLEIGFAVSLPLIGAAVGAFFAGQLANRFGRIRCMMAASILFFVSSIGSGFPHGIYDFVLWRIVGGLGVGVASIIVPAYIAEISPARMRGRLGSLQQLSLVTGIFIALLSNFIIVSISGSAEKPLWLGQASWKWMFWVKAVPAVLYGIIASVLPESPQYLVAHKREAEAEKVLKRLIPVDAISKKIEDIKKSLVKETAPKLSDLWEKGKLKPIVWIGLGLASLQQVVGINVIFYYGDVLWRSVGFAEQDSLMLNVLSSVINIATTLIAIAVVDNIGRKPLLRIGSIGMCVTLLTMCVIFATSPTEEGGNPVLSTIFGYDSLHNPITDYDGNILYDRTSGVIAVIAANLYIVFFGMSWGPVMWVMLGEMFNNRIRGAALALCGLVQWLANFAVSTTFPPLTAHLGLGGSYGVYTAFAFISIIFVGVAIKETKGKELEDM
jgi:SP family sugar:H+ symporter-like MFS transporter